MINDRLTVTAKVQNTPLGSHFTEEKTYSFDIPSESRTEEVLKSFAGLMELIGYHKDSIKRAMEEYE